MARTRRRAEEALVDQGWATHTWLSALGPEEFGRATVLPGWDAHALLAHLEQLVDEMLTVFVRATAPVQARARAVPLPNTDLVARYAGAADEMSARVLAHAAAYSPDVLLERLAETLDRVGEVLATPDTWPVVVTSARGPVTPADFVATRVVELVVHADDLSRTFPEREPVPLERPALGVACRALANVLATRYPGRSVEVRIPPYAAVQCSAVRDGVLDPGPTHTRGTPPNVVETDAVTFLRLCTGRTAWDDALTSGVIAASGLRADLSEMVPLLA
jgi:uncharacterized protein (TIGR03083 family)